MLVIAVQFICLSHRVNLFHSLLRSGVLKARMFRAPIGNAGYMLKGGYKKVYNWCIDLEIRNKKRARQPRHTTESHPLTVLASDATLTSPP